VVNQRNNVIMKKCLQKQSGSTMIYALLTIVILSLIAANVLVNSTTRYNVSSKQVKGWKEALYAAEAGGDVAFAEVRKLVTTGLPFSAQFVADGWSVSASPTPGPAYVKGPITFGQSNGLSATVTVDSATSTNGFACYRIRSVGTAKLFGLLRVGMDDRMNSTTKGDSLIRKIDFKYDHFLSTYGDGDGNNTKIQAVSNPQITRRVETVAVPQWSFTGALKATAGFNGPGSAGVIDSYDSKNGAYYFAANNPSDPHYSDATNGDVAVGSSTFSEGGPIYGNLTTNGANATHSNTNVSGTIDNNVPFSIPPLVEPDTTGYLPGSGSTLNVPPGTTPSTPAQYVYNSLSGGLTINGQNVLPLLPNAGKPAETYVTIVVNGDVGGTITIKQGVNAKIYFTGNLSAKANNVLNNNVDGATGTYNVDGTPSTTYSRAGHLQFYGISPTGGSTQTIDITPPGNVWATFYAPNANLSMIGNPDIFGAIVCKNFTGNGNTGFHYDKEIIGGIPIDYQVASYVEDIR
jgi:hypothetical protein